MDGDDDNDSVLGDLEAGRKTYKEFVVYDADQVPWSVAIQVTQSRYSEYHETAQSSIVVKLTKETQSAHVVRVGPIDRISHLVRTAYSL